MTKFNKALILLITIATLVACGNDKKKNKPGFSKPKTSKEEVKKDVKQTSSSGTGMSNKGIGPIKSVDISKPINKVMADKGKDLFKNKCSACHRTTKRFIGPNPTGIFERRTPEWVMNMILNPDEMIQKDPIAKKLLMEYNGSPMANQNLTKEEARNILEFFRTLKSKS